MANSDKVRAVNSASNSFSRVQLLAQAELYRKARTVPELRVLMRSEPMVESERKVLSMLATIKARGEAAR